MTQKTKTQLQSDIATDFPTNNTGLITAAIMRTWLTDITDSVLFQATGQCYFQWNSLTQVALMPLDGGRITIAGLGYQIPTGGLVQGNTNVYISGTLSATGFSTVSTTTVYDAYVWVNASVLALDFYPTTSGTHSPDTTVGNIGVEIHTGDSTRSYIGKVCIDASGHFANEQSFADSQPQPQAISAVGAQGIGCLSWFNRRRCHLGITSLLDRQTTTSIIELVGTRIYYLTFGQDAVAGKLQYLIATGDVTKSTELTMYIDSQQPGSVPWTPDNRYSGVGSWGNTFSMIADGVWAIFNGNPSEGLHYNSAFMEISGATAACSNTVSGDTHIDVLG